MAAHSILQLQALSLQCVFIRSVSPLSPAVFPPTGLWGALPDYSRWSFRKSSIHGVLEPKAAATPKAGASSHCSQGKMGEAVQALCASQHCVSVSQLAKHTPRWGALPLVAGYDRINQKIQMKDDFLEKIKLPKQGSQF